MTSYLLSQALSPFWRRIFSKRNEQILSFLSRLLLAREVKTFLTFHPLWVYQFLFNSCEFLFNSCVRLNLIQFNFIWHFNLMFHKEFSMYKQTYFVMKVSMRLPWLSRSRDMWLLIPRYLHKKSNSWWLSTTSIIYNMKFVSNTRHNRISLLQVYVWLTAHG